MQFPVHCGLMNICGDVNAGLLLSYILHTFDVLNKADFYMSDIQLCNEVAGGAMGISAFKSAKARIVELGFVKVKIEGLGRPTRYIRDLDTCRAINHANLHYTASHMSPEELETE